MADENDPIDRDDTDVEEVQASEPAAEVSPGEAPEVEAARRSEGPSAEAAHVVEGAVAVGAASAGPSVSTARFPPILEEAPGEEGEGRNLDLLMDVAVPITAEIGRTDLPLADVLRLGTGSVVELDKSADEPVDILVNGKLLATGEVVVVGDRFGVRILDVVDRPD